MVRRLWLVLALAGGLGALGCEPDERPPELPDPAAAAAWFGEGTEAELSGNVLVIRGTMDPEFLRRGGRIWERSGPYFYLFSVHVRDLFRKYPDLAAVRVITQTEDGEELARATLLQGELSEIQWRKALALASLAQTQGTENPRRIEDLIRWGEDYTEHRYAR